MCVCVYRLTGKIHTHIHTHTQAYRQEAMKWHPDRHAMKSEADKQLAEERFKLVSEASAILQVLCVCLCVSVCVLVCVCVCVCVCVFVCVI